MNLLHRDCFIRFFIFSATIVVVLSFLCPKGSAQEKTAADQPVAAAATLTKEIVSEKLSVTRKALAAISASAGKESPEGLSRTLLQRQIELFEQELSLITKDEAQTALKTVIEERLKSAEDQLAELSAKRPPQPPVAPDKKGFESFNAGVDQQRDRVAALRNTIPEHGKRLEALPNLIAETRKESEAAEKNASLLAEKQLERLEQELELYSKAYEQQLALAQQQKVDSLARKEKEVARSSRNNTTAIRR